MNQRTGYGFAFACWMRLRAKTRHWSLMAKRVHGWHCYSCRHVWREMNPERHQ